MVEFKTKAPEIMFASNGDLKVLLTAPREYATYIEGLPKDKELEVTIKRFVKRRSLDANALLWVMCDRIAQKVDTTKEDVYKRFIRDYGVFQIVPIKCEAVESFSEKWSKHGLGWFCEDMDGSKIDGYKRVIIYFGSSTYNTQEMARVLEQILIEAKGLGIPTMTPEEMQSLCATYNVE